MDCAKSEFAPINRLRYEKVAVRTWREAVCTSCSVAGLVNGNMEPVDQLIIKVDETRYKAKRQGKNQILSCSPT